MPDSGNISKYEPTENIDTDELPLDPVDGVRKLFTDGLKDIYWAENQLILSLPKMAKSAYSKELQQAILNHLEQTKAQVERIEQVFEILERKPMARKCDAMEGLVKEGEAVIETTDARTPARDLGITMASQKVEHYEMAAYAGLIQLAEALGEPSVVEILSQSLTEESDSDAKLSEIATDILSDVSEEEKNDNSEPI